MRQDWLAVECVQHTSSHVSISWGSDPALEPIGTFLTVTDETLKRQWRTLAQDDNNPSTQYVLAAGHRYKVELEVFYSDVFPAEYMDYSEETFVFDMNSADAQPADERKVSSMASVQHEGNCYETESYAETHTLYRLRYCSQLVAAGADDFNLHRAKGAVSFRAESTKRELMSLVERAESFSLLQGGHPDGECLMFYRNKPEMYWRDIFMNHFGRMECYTKDNNGDQASPINGELDGLFFGVNVSRHDGLPLAVSNFGTERLSIPAAYMFNTAPRMYFADFYCNRTAHYVTLVMTRCGSRADAFCAQKLLQVNTRNNSFLRHDPLTGKFWVSNAVYVEVLYTEDVNLMEVISEQWAYFSTTPTRGTSRPGGIPKNASCEVCNIRPSR